MGGGEVTRPGGMMFEPGQRVHISKRPDLPRHVRVDIAMPTSDGWQLFVEVSPHGTFAKIDLTDAEAAACEILVEDGAGDSRALLAGLWTAWMRAAGSGARSAVLASCRLVPMRTRRTRFTARCSPAKTAVSARRRARYRQDDHGGVVPAGDAATRLRPPRADRRPRPPGNEVAGRLRAVFRRRSAAITAQTVREHGSRVATTCGWCRLNWLR